MRSLVHAREPQTIHPYGLLPADSVEKLADDGAPVTWRSSARFPLSGRILSAAAFSVSSYSYRHKPARHSS
jgi:hypothetical protein